MSVIPGTSRLLSTGALSGFASFRFGSDNARLCHFCLVHEACCSLSAILAEAFPTDGASPDRLSEPMIFTRCTNCVNL